MNLLFPLFLGSAVLLGLPVVLHLLKRQPRKYVPFPSLFFLGQEALHDSNRHRLRRWLTFLLRCLLILLIVLAFCRPFWPLEHTENSRAVIVVVDNSYSMQAAGRSAAVEAWLAPQLASLRAPDQLGVLVMHPSPTWLVPLSADLEAGREALKSLPQSYETSHYRAGIELAGAKLALSSLQQKQTLLAADQQQLGWGGVRFDRPLPPGVKLFPAPPAAAPKRQAAIVGLKAARIGGGKVALDATVRGYSAESDERTVTFYANEKAVGTQRAVLAGGRPQTVHIEFAAADINAPLMLHATIDADELTVDDIAYAALAGANDRHVILTAGKAGEAVDFLGLALGAVRGGKLPAFRVDAPSAADAAWQPSSVAVLRGSAPFRGNAARTLETFLEAGGSAWVICDGSPEQTAWLARQGVTTKPARTTGGEKLKLRDLALDHPLFAPFAGHSIAALLAPTFHRGWTLQGALLEPLARWPDRSVAVAEVPTSGGRLLITGFGDTRADSTFPVEASYLPFIHQAVTWLAQNPMAAPIDCRVGATLTLPGKGTWRSVLGPKPIPQVEVDGFVLPTSPGLYAFEQPNAPKRFYAVNLDTVESDLTPWPTPGDFPKLSSAEPAGAPARQVAEKSRPEPAIDAGLVDERQVWWWLLVAAVGVLFLELALANRTIP
jgi:hypothetical protein